MARILRISAKCADLFTAELDGQEYQGYVPDFFPGDHYGDYVQLDIDVDSGRIVNWRRPTKVQLTNLFKDQ